MTIIQWIQKRPWLYVIAAFAILITSWVFLLTLAAKHQPEKIEVSKTTKQSSHG